MIQPKFDQYASHYDRTTPIQGEVAHYLWQKIAPHQNFLLNQTWLDIGCGTGNLSHELLNQALLNQALLNQMLLNNVTQSNFQLIALDKSTAMLGQFSQRICQKDSILPLSQKINFLTADMTALPLENNSVDRVMSSFAVHWADTSVLDELVRVSRVGGQVHLAIPVVGSLSAVSERFPLLPIFPFLSADDWLKKIETLLTSRRGQASGGHWLYQEQRTFFHAYANLANLLKSLKQMGGAVSGQTPMNGAVLKQYLADSQPIDLDYRVLVVGFQV